MGKPATDADDGATTEAAARKVIQHMLDQLEPEPDVDRNSFDCKRRLVTVCQTPSSDDSSRGYSSDRTLHEPRDDDEFRRAYCRYGQASHMGVLDPGYKIFTSKRGYGSLIYTVRNRTLVLSGDPLCPPCHFRPLLKELRRFRRANGWSLACIGVTKAFADYSQKQGWLALQFGRERVVNPTTNKVLHSKGTGKRMTSQIRQLLDPKRGGITIHIYAPTVERIEPALELELQAIYDDWRKERNCKKRDSLQTYVTVFDLFSRCDMTFFIYARDRQGHVKGFAALRSLGASKGFHLDPCVASSTAPRGITDLLVVTATKYLSSANVTHLSLGYEPFLKLRDLPEKDCAKSRLARTAYRQVVDSAQLCGKKQYNDKFHPDEELSTPLYIVLPGGLPLLSQAVAVMHVANIKIRRLVTQSAKQACHQINPSLIDPSLSHRRHQAAKV